MVGEANSKNPVPNSVRNHLPWEKIVPLKLLHPPFLSLSHSPLPPHFEQQPCKGTMTTTHHVFVSVLPPSPEGLPEGSKGLPASFEALPAGSEALYLSLSEL